MRGLVALLLLIPFAVDASTLVESGPRRMYTTVLSRQVQDTFWHYLTGDPPVVQSAWGRYGCDETETSVPDVLRPGRVYQTQSAIHAASPSNTIVKLGSWFTGTPPGAANRNPLFAGDVARIWANEQPTVRLGMPTRFDVITGEPRGGSSLSRTNPFEVSCPDGTLGARGGGFCTMRAPICNGGSRDGKWAPLDEAAGYSATGNAYCPGGTVVATDRSHSWFATVTVAEFDADKAKVDPFTTRSDISTHDLGAICDGVTPLDNTGGFCGTGYPNFADQAAALANLPERSIGRYLASIAYPWTHRPRYYGGVSAPTGYSVSGYALDLRIPQAREWLAASQLQIFYDVTRALTDHLSEAEIRAYPLAAAVMDKPGWWTWYDPAANPTDTTCDVTHTAAVNQWRGPPWYLGDNPTPNDCAPSAGGPINKTFYGRGEYEENAGLVALSILEQTADVAGNYFTNVALWSEEAPQYRDKGNAASPPALRKDNRYWGYRTGDSSVSEFDACAKPVRSFLYGPYELTGDADSVRVTARVEGPQDTTCSWDITGCSGCSMLDPVTGGAAAANDPQPVVASVPAGDSTIIWTCGASSATTTITRDSLAACALPGELPCELPAI